MFCSIGGKQALWHPSMSRCPVYDKGTGDPPRCYVPCRNQHLYEQQRSTCKPSASTTIQFTQYIVRVDSMEFLELLQRQLWRWTEAGREEVPARGVLLPRIGQTGGGL